MIIKKILMTRKHRMYSKSILILLCPLLFACGGKKSADSTNADTQNGLVTFHLNAPPSKVEPLLLSELADSVSYVALETTKETLTKDGVQYGDRFYTIVDKKLLCFDENGKFLHQVGKYGQGPDEYIWYGNYYGGFNVDITTNWVFCHTKGEQIQVYDEKGKYIKSLEEDGLSCCNKVYDNHVFIYTSDSTYVIDTRTNKRVWFNKISAELREKRTAIDKEYKGKEWYSSPGMNAVFYSSNDALYIWSATRSDTLFEINRKEFRPLCLLTPQNKYKYEDNYDETGKSILMQPLVVRMYILKNKILLNVKFFTSLKEESSKNWVLCNFVDGSVTYYTNYIVNDLDGGPNILTPIASGDNIYSLSVEDLKNDEEIHNSYFTEGIKAKLKDQDGKFQRLLEPLADDANPIIRTIHWKH